MSPVATALHGAVTLYQWTLRPLIGSQCRFHPHCSAYAKQAIATHGAARGAWLTAGRVLRCNPWHPGGPDPVPAPPDTAATAGPHGTPSGAAPLGPAAGQ